MIRESWHLDIQCGIVQEDPAVLLREWGLIDAKGANEESKNDDPGSWQQISDEALRHDFGLNEQQITKWKNGLKEYTEV